MSKAAFDLVIVGVGGQGTLLASKILGRLALSENCGVKVSEVHGMSQRGGSVITHVRVGDSVHSPMVALGGADYLISFEALEAARAAWLSQARRNGHRQHPAHFAHAGHHRRGSVPGQPAFRPGILPRGECRRAGHRGGVRQPEGADLVLLGMFSRHLPFEEAAWRDAIAACVPQKTLEVNLAAFARGRALMG